MDINSLESNLKAGKLSCMYLLYGDETFLLDSSVKKIKKLFGNLINGINYIQIDNNNVTEIIADIQTPAFGYPKKLIVAKDTGLFQKTSKRGKKSTSTENSFADKLAEYLKENFDLIKDEVILVFIESEIEKNTLYEIIDKNGCVCNFEKQKPIDIAKRLKSICNSYQVNIDGATLNYLIDSCGISMQDLINEIRKQIEYVGSSGTITKETIDLLAIKQFESVIFDLTDSLGRRRITDALDILRNLIFNKEPVQKIFITLYNHFKKLYITKMALNTNKDLASSLNLKPNQIFLTTKYKVQSKFFTEKDLRNIIQELCDLDYNFKSGKIDLQVGLETVLCRYCS